MARGLPCSASAGWPEILLHRPAQAVSGHRLISGSLPGRGRSGAAAVPGAGPAGTGSDYSRCWPGFRAGLQGRRPGRRDRTGAARSGTGADRHSPERGFATVAVAGIPAARQESLPPYSPTGARALERSRTCGQKMRTRGGVVALLRPGRPACHRGHGERRCGDHPRCPAWPGRSARRLRLSWMAVPTGLPDAGRRAEPGLIVPAAGPPDHRRSPATLRGAPGLLPATAAAQIAVTERARPGLG